MNTSSDAAEQIVRMSLEGFQVVAKVSGSGAKDIAALLYAVMKDNRKTKGKTTLSNMLKSGKELKVFSINNDMFNKFAEEAKRYGVLYCALKNKKEVVNDGITDIIVRTDDAPKINRIVDRFKLAQYDEVSIRGEIERTRENKNIEEKETDEKQLPEKDKKLENPNLAKTEKSPQSEPSLKTQKTSDQGTRFFDKRQSVRKKLEKAKIEADNINKSRKKSKVIEHQQINKKKRKKKER